MFQYKVSVVQALIPSKRHIPNCCNCWYYLANEYNKKGKVLPHSFPSVGPVADPGVQAVSPQVTWSHPPGGRLPLLSARPAVTFPAEKCHRPSAGTKLYCLVTEAHTCEQLAQGCHLEVDWPRFEPATFRIASERSPVKPHRPLNTVNWSNQKCIDLNQTSTAHVAQWSKHSGAVCSRAWCSQWPRFKPQPGRVCLPKNYFK